MVSVGTQVISRKQLASANTPPYIKDVEVLLEVALQKSATATNKEQKRTIKIPDLEKALGILESSSSEHPPVEHLLALAEVHWELENSKESIAFLKKAITLAPKDARPYALLGRYLLNKGLRDQALNFLDRAIVLDTTDVQSKKLRERAARQARKSYTVVVNAQDLAKGPEKKDKASKQEQKAEATRLLDIDALRAEQALEQVAADEGSENAVIDKALSALLGASLSNADTALLLPDEKWSGTATKFLKTAIVFMLVGFISLVGGAVFQRARPKTEVKFGNEVQEALFKSSPKSLLTADAMMIQNEKLGMPQERALVYALLYADFGKDLLHLDTAVEGLEKLDDKQRQTPEGLLLRALVQQSGDAKEDKGLDADIEKSLQKPTHKGRSFEAMARVERLKQRGDQALSIEVLSNAALVEDAAPRSLLLLAKLEAAIGNLPLAKSYISHGLKRHPAHAPFLSFGLLLWGTHEPATEKEEPKKKKAKNDDSKGSEKKELTASEKEFARLGAQIEVLLEENTLKDEDAAMVAVVYGTLILAMGDDVKSGSLMEYGRRGAKENAAILNTLSDFYLLAVLPEKAVDLLEDGATLVDGSVPLLANLTRAKLLKGLPDKPLRTLRGFSKPHIDGTDIVLLGGRFAFDPMKTPIALRAHFDARYFPESAINHALDKQGLTPSIAERRLRNVADLKLAEILISKGTEEDSVAKAEAHLRRVRKNNGDNQPEYYLVLARLHRLEGDDAAVLEAIGAALDLESDDPRVVLAAARLQLENQNYSATLRCMKGLKETDLRSPQEASLRARALIGLGKLDAADEVIRNSSVYAKQEPTLLQSSIHLLFTRGNLGDARRETRKLVRAKPTTARAMAERDPLLAALLIAEEEKESRALAKLVALSELHKDHVGPKALQAMLLEKSAPDEAKALWAEVADRSSGGLAELARERANLADDGKSSKNIRKKKRKKRKGRRRR
ncbi:MAG: hypothetical protein GY822_09575 [Deltaproteobacteria bacterium]|nr:hypothetical protein [Deltaproteobacteria bacterium]